MKAMITSILFSIINITLMLLFAASKLGRTPLWLPLCLFIVSVNYAVVFIVSLFRCRKESFIFNFICTVIWIALSLFNLWAVQSLMIVA